MREPSAWASRPDLEAIAPSHFSRDQAYHRVATFYHQLEQADIASAWESLELPALFMHGGLDWLSTAEDSRALVELVGPSAELADLPGIDHQMSDAPEGAPLRLAPKVRDTLLRWLASDG